MTWCSRRTRWALGTVVSAVLPVAWASGLPAQSPRVAIEVEAGPVWISRNVVQIPNNATATRFSLKDVTGAGPWPAGRVYLTWNLNRRHSLRALAAPLSITTTGRLPAPVRFAGGSFTDTAPVEATYAFNSYRLTYRYALRESDRAHVWLGFTAKLRDATVQLQQGGTSGRKDDVGFVPLLHVAGDRRVGGRWWLSTDIDALAGGPGRAIDGAVKLGYAPTDRLSLHAGYRTVEGGADVDEVYNFSWLHYAVASVKWRW